MNLGLYTAFLGMRSRQRTLDVQANNIANASTVGFKAEKMLYSSFEAARKSEDSTQKLVAGVAASSGTDFTTGGFQQTGRSLDVAIEGDAFLQIQTQRGVRFTRAGNLSLNADGQLVTKNGELVVGQNGPVTVPPGGELSIGEDGGLSVKGEAFEQLRLVRFDNPANALIKEGDSLFMMTGAEQPAENINSKVIQGTLETSNINSISEMVAMINNNREFESLQKNVSMIMNDMGRKIAGELGKL